MLRVEGCSKERIVTKLGDAYTNEGCCSLTVAVCLLLYVREA